VQQLRERLDLFAAASGSTPATRVLQVASTLTRPEQCLLPDGTVGYYIRRGDDCMAAALATLIQVPLDEVPNARLVDRASAGEGREQTSRSAWEELERFAASRGLRFEIHDPPPWRRARWVGVIPGGLLPHDGHALLMCRKRIVFDPSSNIDISHTWTIDRIAWGLTAHKRRS
jgi:hypothetical protein